MAKRYAITGPPSEGPVCSRQRAVDESERAVMRNERADSSREHSDARDHPVAWRSLRIVTRSPVTFVRSPGTDGRSGHADVHGTRTDGGRVVVPSGRVDEAASGFAHLADGAECRVVHADGLSIPSRRPGIGFATQSPPVIPVRNRHTSRSLTSTSSLIGFAFRRPAPASRARLRPSFPRTEP